MLMHAKNALPTHSHSKLRLAESGAYLGALAGNEDEDVLGHGGFRPLKAHQQLRQPGQPHPQGGFPHPSLYGRSHYTPLILE